MPLFSRHISNIETIGHSLLAVAVVAALTGLTIEQVACNARVIHLTAVFILQLIKTAFATAITQAFPLIIGKILKLPITPKTEA